VYCGVWHFEQGMQLVLLQLNGSLVLNPIVSKNSLCPCLIHSKPNGLIQFKGWSVDSWEINHEQQQRQHH
jgi:hypothetical protein